MEQQKRPVKRRQTKRCEEENRPKKKSEKSLVVKNENNDELVKTAQEIEAETMKNNAAIRLSTFGILLQTRRETKKIEENIRNNSQK